MKDKKQEILEMLARKEISKEEAESKLSELKDTTEPEQAEVDQMAYQTAPPKSNKGCLIVIIIAICLLPLLLVILGGLFMLLWKDSRSVETYRVPSQPKTYESSMSDTFDSGKNPPPADSEIIIEVEEK